MKDILSEWDHLLQGWDTNFLLESMNLFKRILPNFSVDFATVLVIIYFFFFCGDMRLGAGHSAFTLVRLL